MARARASSASWRPIQNLLGAVSLFPGARAADAARHRKPLVTWTVGGFARLALLALALVPWLTDAPRTAIWLIIALNGVRSFMSNFGNPAWTVLVGDLVPPRLRAQYFGNRNLMIMLAALVVAPLAGWLIKAGNGWLGQPNLGYQAVFTLAFLTGLAGTLCFVLVPEPHRAAPGRGRRPARRPGSGARSAATAPSSAWSSAGSSGTSRFRSPRRSSTSTWSGTSAPAPPPWAPSRASTRSSGSSAAGSSAA